jgi:hypothetical protein
VHLHALQLVFPSSLPLYGARSGHLCEYHNPFFPLLDTYPNCTHNFNPAGKKQLTPASVTTRGTTVEPHELCSIIRALYTRFSLSLFPTLYDILAFFGGVVVLCSDSFSLLNGVDWQKGVRLSPNGLEGQRVGQSCVLLYTSRYLNYLPYLTLLGDIKETRSSLH